MKKNVTIFCIGLLFTLFTTTNSFAQLTINQSDLQSLVGNSYSVKTYQSSTGSDFTNLVSQTGANQTFDFTTMSSFSEAYTGKIQYLGSATNLPGSNITDLQKANIVIKVNLKSTTQSSDSTSWIYQHTSSDSVNLDGDVFISQTDIDGDGISPDTVKIVYKPALVYSKLPLSYKEAWKDTSSYSLTVSGTQVTQTVQVQDTVDGYGTLKTPSGNIKCLRIKRETTTITSVAGFKSTSHTGSINFVTKSGAEIAATIQLDASGNPISAQYTESTLITGIKNQASDNIPQKYKLEQNYPNPFNPTTVIKYQLKKAGNVKLDVYNLLGQKVATLVNTNQTAGLHRVTFDADNLNSGIYFYKIEAGNFTQTKKMMLIK